jgi:hypothetical protein
MTTMRARRAVGIIIAAATGVTATFVAQSLSAEPLRVGVASVDITPPVGAPMAGYYHARGADGVLDPLMSKALVIQRNDARMAFVALDIISVTRNITDLAREKIEEQTGIPGSHVMISATHAHTGPELARRNQRVVDLGGKNKTAVEYTEALPEITPEEVEAARKAVAATKDDRGANFMTLVRSYRTLDVAGRRGKPHRVEVQAIALGNDVAWVSLPGEVFVELGLAIKKRSPFPQTFIVELANENIGYIPDRRSYAEGNYEPESARCAAGSGEKLVDVAVRLLDELHR